MTFENKVFHYVPLVTLVIGSLLYFGNTATTAPFAICSALLAFFGCSYALMRHVLADPDSGVEILLILLAMPALVSLLSITYAIHTMGVHIADSVEQQAITVALFASILSHVGLFAFIVAGAQQFAKAETFRQRVSGRMVIGVTVIFGSLTMALICLGVSL